MRDHLSRILVLAVGALLVSSVIAIAQESTPQPWMEPSQKNARDSLPKQDTLQRGLQDTSLPGVRDSVQGSSGEYFEPDITGINKRDHNKEEATADDQGQSSTDIEMTRKIRQAIMDDDSLSTYAKNIKIITKDGMVTLKGPVRSLEERTSIEAKAAAVAGAGKITNQIEVKTASSSEND